MVQVLQDGRRGMGNPFRSSRLKIDRAKRHVNDLDIIISRFDNHSYELVAENDSEPGYYVHKYRIVDPEITFDDVSIIAGDAVNNIRAALDHAVYGCAIASGNANPEGWTCSFIIRRKKEDFIKAVNGCTSVPEQIRDCLRRFEPYETGNRFLWSLHEMCNRDKHALITPALIGFDALGIEFLGPGQGSYSSPPSGNVFWNRDKNEIELFRSNSADTKYELAMSLEIVFQGEGFGGIRIVPLLNAFVDIAESILVTLEGESRRLFPAAFV